MYRSRPAQLSVRVITCVRGLPHAETFFRRNRWRHSSSSWGILTAFAFIGKHHGLLVYFSAARVRGTDLTENPFAVDAVDEEDI